LDIIGKDKGKVILSGNKTLQKIANETWSLPKNLNDYLQ
jgi:hypothetical protein